MVYLNHSGGIYAKRVDVNVRKKTYGMYCGLSIEGQEWAAKTLMVKAPLFILKC